MANSHFSYASLPVLLLTYHVSFLLVLNLIRDLNHKTICAAVFDGVYVANSGKTGHRLKVFHTNLPEKLFL